MSEIIGKRIAVKKAGREYHALCPFHNEKTPSFTINDEKAFFHCFGCGKHGDAITFLMEYERMTYPEAVEQLSRDAGIEMPRPDPAEARRAAAEKTVLDVLEAAAQWFTAQLSGPSGMVARSYVLKRGLNPETQALFRVGYAPDEKSALHQYLNTLGFNQKLQAEAGLIIQPESGGAPLDRFRGRLMFPIRSPSGKVVAFGGRLIVENPNIKLAKYLNSPETPVFRKGEMLFNLDLARRTAREKEIAVVMEGYMDVVSTAQSGISYAVATLGTAVTPEHLRLLWQLCKEPVMCLDGDAAGKRAMSRASEIVLPLLKPGFALRFAVLPQGDDPDSYIQKHGKGSFEKILQKSKRLSQVLWEDLSSRHRLDAPEGLAALEDASKKLTDKIADPVVRKDYLDYLRREISACRQKLWDKTRQRAQTQQPRSPQVMQMMVSHHSAALESLIKQMFAILLMFPSLLHKSAVEETLSHLDIRNHSLDALRNALIASFERHDIDTHEALAAYIHQQLPEFDLSYIHSEAISLGSCQTADDGWKAWNNAQLAYQEAHLILELKAFEDSLGQSIDESAYSRLVELQQALKKIQVLRTFAPAEPDAA